MLDINTIIKYNQNPTTTPAPVVEKKEQPWAHMETDVIAKQTTINSDDIFAGLEKAIEEGANRKFEGLHSGDYLVVTENAKIKNTSTGSPFISFSFKVMDGEFVKRTEFSSIFLKDKDGQWSSRAMEQISQFIKSISNDVTEDGIKSVIRTMIVEFTKTLQTGKNEYLISEFVGSQLVLSIKSYEYEIKDQSGNGTGQKRAGKNYFFKKAQ